MTVFFNPPTALTFDDVLLRPQYSDIPSRSEVDISSSITPDIRLSLPIISANMNSVTEHKTAIAMALGTESGNSAAGMGFIHRFNTIEQQVAEVEKVKRFRSYIIEKPYVIEPDKTIRDAEALMDEHEIGGLMVVGEEWLLIGIITRRDIYAESPDRLVRDAMTPRDKMTVAPYKEMQKRENTSKAKDLMHESRIEKLPLINDEDQPVGLIVMKDIRKLEDYPNASINDKGQLIVGAAVGVIGDHLERAQALIDAGVDVIVSDVAHAHHSMVKASILELQKLSDLPIVGGTVAGKDSYRFLAEMGRDHRKTGKEGGLHSVACGIGSGCFAAGTRVLMGNGTYKNIEDVLAGDRVINKDGKSVRVNKAWMTGYKQVNKVRHTQSACPTYVTPDHRYWAGDYNEAPSWMPKKEGVESMLIHEKAKIRWKAIGDFDRDTVILPGKINYDWEKSFKIDLKDYSVEDCEKFRYNRFIKSNYNVGYIFGTFLGDGYSKHRTAKRGDGTTKVGSVQWYFGINEKETANKLADAIEKEMGKRPVISYSQVSRMIHVNFHSKQWGNFFQQFGKKNEKHLPERFLIDNYKYLKGVYDGLVDSDGYREKQRKMDSVRVGFTNTSPQLIELFAVISHKLFGAFPSQMKRKKNAGNLKNCNPDNLRQSYEARLDSGHNRRVAEDYQIVKLLENETTDQIVPVYDIEVDCPTHSFIANNAIVHNSICSTRLVSGHGMPQMQALYECYIEQQKDFPDVSIIADGGMQKPADIDKALVFADAVKLGSMLAGTPEAPGEVLRDPNTGQQMKMYRGMASKEAFEQKLQAEGVSDLTARSVNYNPEGVSAQIPLKPHVKELLSRLAGSLRSCLSYSGSRNMEEFKEKAEFVRITDSGVSESDTHIFNQYS